jgi:hypothetical protein
VSALRTASPDAEVVAPGAAEGAAGGTGPLTGSRASGRTGPTEPSTVGPHPIRHRARRLVRPTRRGRGRGHRRRQFPPPASRSHCGGRGRAYWRDADGTWRYREGRPGPGASDLRPRTCSIRRSRCGRPRGPGGPPLGQPPPDHPLAWVFEHAELGARRDPVPEPAWAARATTVVAMAAPELHRTTSSASMPWRRSSGSPAVRAHLARDRRPLPPGASVVPVWRAPDRPVVAHLPPVRRHPAPDLPADADPALDGAEAADARSPAGVEPEPTSPARRRRPRPRTGPATDGG